MACLLSGNQKHRTSLRQTSVLSMQNLRPFSQRSPMFCTFRTTASLPPSTKKVFENLLHFLHHSTRSPVFTDNFGCRIGCRIEAGCRMNPTFSALFTLFSPLLGPQHPAFPYDSVPNSAQNCSTIGRFLNGSSAKHSKWFCCIGGFYCGQIRLSMAGFSFPHPAPYHAKQGVKSAKTVLLV